MALLLAAVAGLWAAGVTGEAALGRLGRAEQWIRGLGRWGPPAYVVIYVLLELAFFPGLPLTILGGLAFGPLWGTAVVSVAATLSAAAAFLVARYTLRDRVERWVRGHPRMARIDAAVAEHGWRILLVTRLVPLFPYNLQNYAYGLTRIGFGRYVLVSWLAMLPGTAAYTLAGSALVPAGRDPRRALLLLGVAALLLVVLSLVPRWLARRNRAASAVLGPP